VHAPPTVPDLDQAAMAAARARQAVLTKPAGALGRLEDLSIWLAGARGTCPVPPFQRIRAVVVAGDHGVAQIGVSAFPPEVTAQMVANFAAGGAAVNVLAAQVGASVRVVDVSVDAPEPTAPGGVDGTAPAERYRVRRSSERIDLADAMSQDEAEAAFAVGELVADEEIDAGADLIIPGEMGIGNTTAAATLVAAILDAEPVEVVGRGTGIDDTRWIVKTAAIRDALRRGRPYAADPVALVRTVGGADLAALAGLLARAAARRTPVILDGVVICAAALVADLYAPGARRWWISGTRSTEPAQALVLEHLGLVPILDLGLRLGEGTGALLAANVLEAARATLADMATFDSAGVSDKGEGAAATASPAGEAGEAT
jgi:nicotinate-nucleotide--dimethylbenzimidazole phosphoribosyltransferase